MNDFSLKTSARSPPVGSFPAGAWFGALGDPRANKSRLFDGKDEAFTLPFLLHVKLKGILSVGVLKGQSQSIKQKKYSLKVFDVQKETLREHTVGVCSLNNPVAFSGRVSTSVGKGRATGVISPGFFGL